MKRSSVLVGGLILVMSAAVVLAESPTVQEMRTTIQQLKARLAALEQQVATQAAGGMGSPVFKAVADAAAARSSLPSWLENFKLFGDLRLRYQGDCFARHEKNRNRARFRLRVGAKKTWLDNQMEVGFRLASGSDDDPTSTNQSFDNSFSEKAVWIDRAYARYQPNWLKGFTVIGGKFATPMVHTDMVWDSDVNPEGVWAQYKAKLDGLEPFVNAGYFIFEENHGGYDGTMAAYQVGLIWKIMKDLKLTLAGTYYDWDHYETEWRYAHGNHVVNGLMAAQAFEVINLTGKLSFKLMGLPMGAYFDWAHNCAEEDTNRGWDGQDNACAAGFKVGANKKKGDWSVGYKYAHIQANSLPGFNDSDFGFSNRKGHVLKATYNITDWLTFATGVFYTEPCSGPHEDERSVTVQADIIWKF